MKYLLCLALIIISNLGYSQKLKVKSRTVKALTGSEFSAGIRDTTSSVAERENWIFEEIRSGNIPDSYRTLVQITDTVLINARQHTITYFALPDFLAIGSDSDYFYCPMTASLAQRVANLLDCSLPTRKISDDIYQNAPVKMVPEPIPPTKEMITVPVFEKHSQLVQAQRRSLLNQFPLGNLVSGNKKDVVISNKIHNDKGLLRVVIYGWHKTDGKAIQPMYNGHKPDWVDYSHGIRLIQNRVWVDGKRTSVQKVLKSEELHSLLSDEGVIAAPFYPVD